MLADSHQSVDKDGLPFRKGTVQTGTIAWHGVRWTTFHEFYTYTVLLYAYVG